MPSIRLAVAGDVILTRDLQAEIDDELLAVAEVLRGVDCAIANLELPLHDFTSAASVAPGGFWLGAFPERAEDLAWFGITAVSRANNHAMDYGAAAMHQTDRALARAGIAHAGTGDDLAAAREPRYFETRAGRVALVSATATFPLASMAGEARPPIPGRPGINPLRRSGERLVEPSEALARVGLPLSDLHVLGSRRPAWLTQPEEDPAAFSAPDAEAVLSSVRQARAHADAVVVALHCHDQGATQWEPSAVVATFARECIRAGSDVVACTGTHALRDLEMFQGRPILHGLGSLFLQPDTVPHLPAEAYQLHGLGTEASVADVYRKRWGDGSKGMAARDSVWQGLIAVVTLRDGDAGVELAPVDLRKQAGPGRWGLPRLAAAASGSRPHG